MLPDLDLSAATLEWLVVLALGTGIGGLLLGISAHVRTRRRAVDRSGPATPDEVLAALRSDAAELAGLRTELADAIRHVAVVRYDAFGDMGGRMSWSVALLDGDGDGLVLTAIHGRSDARSYAKGIKGGTGEQPLSPEEQQAITFALRPTRAPAPRRG